MVILTKCRCMFYCHRLSWCCLVHPTHAPGNVSGSPRKPTGKLNSQTERYNASETLSNILVILIIIIIIMIMIIITIIIKIIIYRYHK